MIDETVDKRYPLAPLKKRNFSKDVYGYDIETYTKGKDNVFYCATIWSPHYKKVLYTKEEAIKEFMHERYRGAIIVTTNLMFDFHGTYIDPQDEYISKFRILYNGSLLLLAKSYVYDGQYNYYPDKHHTMPVTFIDTLNFAKLSVKDMGKILGLPKIDQPQCFARKPKTFEEFQELIIYNMRDSEISCRFFLFLAKGFDDLGGRIQNTIASTSMNIFRSKYLKSTYWRHDKMILKEQFKGYYGGRTEIFKRGLVENANYYDFSSLYPACMKKELPDINTLRVNNIGNKKLLEYPGMSDVHVIVPYMKIPPLPFRYDNKLIFPVGGFRGWYTHNELNYALSLGCSVEKMYKTYYYTKTCHPFNDFVDDLYKKRKSYGKSKMAYVVKIILNSLYGKFGQKFYGKSEYVPVEVFEDSGGFGKKGNYEFNIGDNFVKVKDIEQRPKVFCSPIWTSYITAYGRMELHKLLSKHDPIYCDTDSIVTKKDIETSIKLGGLEKEDHIKKGFFIKPKFYGYHNDNDTKIIRLKGFPRVTWDDFDNILEGKAVTFTKFMKWKEAQRRQYTVNSIIDVSKFFTLDDNKRAWSTDLKLNDLFGSSPHFLTQPKT